VNRINYAILVLGIIFLYNCAAPQKNSETGGPYYNGGGGIGLKIVIPALDTKNFFDAEGWLSIFVQGVLTDDFTKYSAITVIDRQNLDRLLAEQQESLSGNYSGNNYISIGNLTNAEFILAGSIIQITENLYDLELAVTKLETGERYASFRKSASMEQLRYGIVIKEASAELLEQMGVELTPYGKKSLLAASNLSGEAALAKGITAQNGGLFAEAFSYYFEAASLSAAYTGTDSAHTGTDSPESIERLNRLSAEISNGALGIDIISDIEQRKRWIQIIRDCAAYFKLNPPFEIIYDPELTQIGYTDYGGERVNLSLKLAVKPIDIRFKILNEILTGLNNTKKRASWGLGEWPVENMEPFDTSTVLLSEDKTFDFKIDAAVLNNSGRIICKSGVELKVLINFESDNTIIIPEQEIGFIYFENIKIKEMLGGLLVKFTKINGVDRGRKNISGNIPVIQVRTAFETDKQDWERTCETYNNKIKEDYVFYKDENGGIVIRDYIGFEKNIRLPSHIDGAQVHQISGKAFFDKALTCVIIPYGIRVIGRSAFENNRLTILKLPSSISTIGDDAFRGNNFNKITVFANISIFQIDHITRKISSLYYNDMHTNRYVTYYEKDGKWRRQSLELFKNFSF
jgi:hypothetical protein